MKFRNRNKLLIVASIEHQKQMTRATKGLTAKADTSDKGIIKTPPFERKRLHISKMTMTTKQKTRIHVRKIRDRG
ncbi:hypothetical protein AL047_07645 [Pseudomonas syringae pv. broussonetiae]|nr:hypothetical protein AL047_07645 [Pseudomonas syringae pv. broussonetiae]